jgi:hypothetical protein
MNINGLITEWMEETRVALITEYDRQGLRASGSYAKSLESQVTDNTVSFKAVMKAARHSEFMQNGRDPNTDQSPEAAKRLYPIILQWVKDKRLNFDKGHVFAICLNKVYHGTVVPNKYNPGGVVSNVVTRDWIDILINKISGGFQSQIKSDVIKQFKNN